MAERVVTLPLEQAPRAVTHWGTRAMAARVAHSCMRTSSRHYDPPALVRYGDGESGTSRHKMQRFPVSSQVRVWAPKLSWRLPAS